MSDSKLQIGKYVPLFTLLDQDGKKVKLGDFAGRWVVLYFYPRDNTSGCTTEACEFTEALSGFEGLNAVVLGCSPDSPESHRKFIEKERLRVRLLSDPDHTVMAKYDAWAEKNMYGKKVIGVVRSTALIDPQGKLAFHWPTVKAAGHAAEVKAKLAELGA